MSRVAKAGITLPSGVEFSKDKETITIKGPKGSLTQHCNKHVSIIVASENDKRLEFSPASNDPQGWAQAGTARALINNMVHGVTQGFQRVLELVGVGYRVQMEGKTIVLSLGFSHPVKYQLPEKVTAEAPNNTTLVLKSIDKQLLGQIASEVRAFRPPEPDKGKGVRYAGEVIMKKEAKKK